MWHRDAVLRVVLAIDGDRDWKIQTVTQCSRPGCLRQSQAGEGLPDLVAASGIGPGLGKDFSKISTFESLESSLGADAIG